MISCWSCSQRNYLFDLADALRVPGGGYRLKEDPHRWLEPYVRRTASKPTKPESLPSAEDIRAWRRMLDNDPDVMRYLLAERGISRHVIERTHLGYDGDAITIPIYHVRTRARQPASTLLARCPTSGGEYEGLAGRTIENGGETVYPALPQGPLILVAGEFDALVLLSHNLPGVTLTSGAATRWRKSWAWMVKGRRVVVIYDADPREQNKRPAAQRNFAGTEQTLGPCHSPKLGCTAARVFPIGSTPTVVL